MPTFGLKRTKPGEAGWGVGAYGVGVFVPYSGWTHHDVPGCFRLVAALCEGTRRRRRGTARDSSISWGWVGVNAFLGRNYKLGGDSLHGEYGAVDLLEVGDDFEEGAEVGIACGSEYSDEVFGRLAEG